MGKHPGHDRQRAIFAAAALRTLAREGLSELTVRNVAQEAGYSTGALVHYFPSKSELFIAATEHAHDVVQPRLDRAETNFKGLESLRQFIYGALPTTVESREAWSVWLVFWDRAKSDPAINKIAQERYHLREVQLERLIRRAQEGGFVGVSPSAATLALVASIVMDGIAVQTLRTDARLSAHRQREVVDAWIGSLPRPSPRKR